MERKIIKIDAGRCSGCGLCVSACHEGAIGISGGKAALLRDDYCDGLGDCLPVCPEGAISFEEREAAAYDEAAVKASAERARAETPACGCPGSSAGEIARESGGGGHEPKAETCLAQWPVQIKLVPITAPYFHSADLLVAAGCSAYAYGNFHADYMKGKVTVIGCPKLDGGGYAEKLAAIMSRNAIKSVTVARMEVPCCGGLEHAAVSAAEHCGKPVPVRTVTISTDGRILKD